MWCGTLPHWSSVAEEAILLRIGRNKILKTKFSKSRKNKNAVPKARDFCLVMSENAKKLGFSAEGAKDPAEGG